VYHRGHYDAFELVPGIEGHEVRTNLDVVVVCLLIRDNGVGDGVRYIYLHCVVVEEREGFTRPLRARLPPYTTL